MYIQKPKAFTLIELLVELLVGCAIIAILAAFFIPSLDAAKEQAERQKYQQPQIIFHVGDTVAINGINSTGVVNYVECCGGRRLDIIVKNDNGGVTELKDVNTAIVKKIQ